MFGTFLLQIDNYHSRLQQESEYREWQRQCEENERKFINVVSSEESPKSSGDKSNDGTALSISLPQSMTEFIPVTETYTITVSDFSLICGSSEHTPWGLRLLFPQPYEVFLLRIFFVGLRAYLYKCVLMVP